MGDLVSALRTVDTIHDEAEKQEAISSVAVALAAIGKLDEAEGASREGHISRGQGSHLVQHRLLRAGTEKHQTLSRGSHNRGRPATDFT